MAEAGILAMTAALVQLTATLRRQLTGASDEALTMDDEQRCFEFRASPSNTACWPDVAPPDKTSISLGYGICDSNDRSYILA